MAGKGFTGGRPVDGELWRGNYENIDFSGGGSMSTREAITILGLSDEDFIPVEEQLTIGEPINPRDVDTALYMQEFTEGGEPAAL